MPRLTVWPFPATGEPFSCVCLSFHFQEVLLQVGVHHREVFEGQNIGISLPWLHRVHLDGLA